MRITFTIQLIIGLIFIAASGCVVNRNDGRVVSLKHSEGLAMRGIWVTRWDFRSPTDVERIMRDASELGITDIFWQVRGQGDAYYRSSIEPWGEELFRDNRAKTDPGFDPLELAIGEAHRRGMRVHAWMNVMPMWRGKAMPRDPKHLLYEHPEWRLYNADGKVQELHDGYVVINPVYEEVQQYLAGIVRDIVRRYDIDGVHLDYIRYLSDEIGANELMPGDAKSLGMYARATGKAGIASRVDRDAYREWIRSRITDLVGAIRATALREDPGILYSAAVWRRPEMARDRYMQDAATWVNAGMIDAVMPMIYSDDDLRYKDDLDAWFKAVDDRRVVPGIGAYKHASAGQTTNQIMIGGTRRFAIFAYSTIFESVNPDQDRSEKAVAERALRRESVQRFFHDLARP
ncbi:MAG: family 10 glycosylhydrolase [Phycisphaerales bacterium]|nr:family 10 glycosylhydrolase [Phycisphaerales bacterium]